MDFDVRVLELYHDGFEMTINKSDLFFRVLSQGFEMTINKSDFFYFYVRVL